MRLEVPGVVAAAVTTRRPEIIREWATNPTSGLPQSEEAVWLAFAGVIEELRAAEERIHQLMLFVHAVRDASRGMEEKAERTIEGSET